MSKPLLMGRMKKIIRNLTDEAGRNFWAAAQRGAEGVSTWPDWRKAGITTEQPGADAPPLDEASKQLAEAVEVIRGLLTMRPVEDYPQMAVARDFLKRVEGK